MVTELTLPQKGRSPPIFGPCLLWPNDCMDQDGIWYGRRPQPSNVVFDGDLAPLPQRGTTPQFLVHVCCGQTVAHLSYCWALVLKNWPKPTDSLNSGTATTLQATISVHFRYHCNNWTKHLWLIMKSFFCTCVEKLNFWFLLWHLMIWYIFVVCIVIEIVCFKNILWCFVCLAKDPFYMQLTRDAYRRMFGNPEDKASYARVIFFFCFCFLIIYLSLM